MVAGTTESWFWTIGQFDDVLVVQVDLTPHDSHEASAYSWLNSEEQERWHRFRYDRPRREYVLCRAALRFTLCARLGCDNERLSFGYAEHGKPFGLVDGENLCVSFNVSHSGKHGLIALASHGRLGVDVEDRTARINIDSIIKTVFTPAEQAEFTSIQESRKRDLFFTFWTLKESLIKALGTGFSLNPARFEIPTEIRRGDKKAVFRFPQHPDDCWNLKNIENEEFAAAIAHEMG